MTTTSTPTVPLSVDGLRVLAAAVAGPGYPDSAPPLNDFVESEFNPLVYRAAWPCLSGLFEPGRENRGGQADPGARTGLILGSHIGDATTLDLASRQLVAGRVHNAILFMQATANAVLGHLSREFAMTGPLLALSTPDVSGELLDAARLWLADGDLDRVLIVGVELTGTDRSAAAHRELGTNPPETDLAVALLLAREDTPSAPPEARSAVPPGQGRGLGLLLSLATIAHPLAGPHDSADSADAGAEPRGAHQ
ncbi:MAG TPA: beta-ketoacyl synthase N-terminal-like domain-containing protein [Actinocrinis sp.]|nr:beta-ketoacyl synthase N-terminal-like domain-containing protein [Actinocrinis sp.]